MGRDVSPFDVSEIKKHGPVIAIDGPAGTGKSSATKRLAEVLGFIHVDTGALYRAIAYLILSRGEEPTEQTASAQARGTTLEFRRMPALNPANRIFADGKDVTPFIRTPEVSMGASLVSSFPGVRDALLQLQRKLGCVGRAILEGRDIGTVIFPDADVKFFMSASVEERAKRRLAELEASGADAPSFSEVKRQISERDNLDMTRKIAPLRKAEGAIEVDTSRMTLDEVVSYMAALVHEQLPETMHHHSKRKD